MDPTALGSSTPEPPLAFIYGVPKAKKIIIVYMYHSTLFGMIM